MARLFPEAGDGHSRVHTRVAGTNGYMAPEYLMHGDLSTKADVFSFGVVVLEIVSGRKNSAFIPPPDAEADSLLEYAWRLYKKGRSLELLDHAVKSSAVPEQVELCVRIGLLCVQADPRLRPDMKRGNHPVQEAEHARGADASGGARVAVPAEAPRPARHALLCWVIVRHQLAVYVRNIGRVSVSVSVGLQRHDDVEHPHHEEPRLALAPRRTRVGVTGRAPTVYICQFFPVFFSLVLIPIRVVNGIAE
uniref:Protein kinase domain-containing protein n=1 Tax=Zea mays TaxID=4577 RepID=B8A0A4_MAIZE|nr:unknown [Zea mays]|eukprot:NP_001146266.1 putative protein kinase superfamily protein [Zea mays]